MIHVIIPLDDSCVTKSLQSASAFFFLSRYNVCYTLCCLSNNFQGSPALCPLLFLSGHGQPGHHLPVWSHRPSSSSDHYGQIYSDFVSFSVHHQQTCTARVQVVLKGETWRGNKIKDLS